MGGGEREGQMRGMGLTDTTVCKIDKLQGYTI